MCCEEVGEVHEVLCVPPDVPIMGSETSRTTVKFQFRYKAATKDRRN